MAERRLIKLIGQIDLDEYSKSCHRLKIPRDVLLGVFEVPRVKNHQKFSPLPAKMETLLYRAENFCGN
jgi:hypothetical protein